MKFFPLLFLIAAIIGIVWAVRVDGADGSVWVTGIATGIFLLWVGVNKYRTGKWFTESSGGH